MNKKLIGNIVKAANKISQQSRTGVADYVVLSPEAIKQINDMITEEKQRLLLLNRKRKIIKLINKNG